MFNSLKLTGECFESIFAISTAIKGTELSNNKILAMSTPEERIRSKSFSEFLNISQSTNDKKTIKHESPFHKYYEDKIKYFKEKTSDHLTFSAQNLTANEFYCPKLFDILIGQFYLIPIWSGIIIKTQNFGYIMKTRLSNNPVENWIGQIKNNILKDDIVSIFLNFFYFSLQTSFISLHDRVCQAQFAQNFTKIFKLNTLNTPT